MIKYPLHLLYTQNTKGGCFFHEITSFRQPVPFDYSILEQKRQERTAPVFWKTLFLHHGNDCVRSQFDLLLVADRGDAVAFLRTVHAKIGMTSAFDDKLLKTVRKI